jgi:hypothetical protein
MFGKRSEWATVILAWNVWIQNGDRITFITFNDHLQAMGISRKKNGGEDD